MSQKKSNPLELDKESAQENNKDIPETPEQKEETKHIHISSTNADQNISISGDGYQNVSITVREEDSVQIRKKNRKTTGRRKTDYYSDSMRDSYYKKSWRELCQKAGTKETEDTAFMDILIQTARDTDRQKNIHKKLYFRIELLLIVIAFVNTLLNSLRVASSLNDEWVTAINWICIILSAIIVLINSYNFLKQPKETWLRHMSLYIHIVTEADRLFSKKDEYNCSERQRMDLFKSKISDYIQEDYQNFMTNMSGTRKTTDTHYVTQKTAENYSAAQNQDTPHSSDQP